MRNEKPHGPAPELASARRTSAIIKIRLMYILKGNDTGNWSDWQQWTLTGA